MGNTSACRYQNKQQKKKGNNHPVIGLTVNSKADGPFFYGSPWLQEENKGAGWMQWHSAPFCNQRKRRVISFYIQGHIQTLSFVPYIAGCLIDTPKVIAKK